MDLKRELLSFYDNLETPLKALLNFYSLRLFGKSFEWFLTNEPHRIYAVVEKSLGRHNAELLMRMFLEHMMRKKCGDIGYIKEIVQSLNALFQ